MRWWWLLLALLLGGCTYLQPVPTEPADHDLVCRGWECRTIPKGGRT